MKRNIIIAAVVIALILAGYFMFRKEAPPTSAKSEPVAVSMIKQTVYLYASSTKTEIVEPVQAFEGDEVETLDFGRALLQMQNGTLTTLDYLTKVTIKNHPDDEHAGMLVNSGKVWSSVEKVFGQGEYYEIETQNAVAVVRGTSFGISFDGVNTILEVSEGAVLFVPVSADGERQYDKAMLVQAGQKAIIGSAGVVEIFNLTSNDTSREWYIYNNGDEPALGAEESSQTPDVRISGVEIKPQ